MNLEQAAYREKNPSTIYPVATENADFDQNFVQVSKQQLLSAPTYYTARDGDSLQSVARAVWGDPKMWYLIADANGLSADARLVEGQNLKIPNTITNIHNNTETSRPYNTTLALGDTNPTLPDAPPVPPKNKKDKCGGLIQFITIVVQAIVTVVATVIAGPVIGAIAGNKAGRLTNTVGNVLAGNMSLRDGLKQMALEDPLTALLSGESFTDSVELMREDYKDGAKAWLMNLVVPNIPIPPGAGQFTQMAIHGANAVNRELFNSAYRSASGDSFDFNWRDVAGNALGNYAGQNLFGSDGMLSADFGTVGAEGLTRSLLNQSFSTMSSAALTETIKDKIYNDHAFEPDYLGATANALGNGIGGTLAQHYLQDYNNADPFSSLMGYVPGLSEAFGSIRNTLEYWPNAFGINTKPEAPTGAELARKQQRDETRGQGEDKNDQYKYMLASAGGFDLGQGQAYDVATREELARQRLVNGGVFSEEDDPDAYKTGVNFSADSLFGGEGSALDGLDLDFFDKNGISDKYIADSFESAVMAEADRSWRFGGVGSASDVGPIHLTAGERSQHVKETQMLMSIYGLNQPILGLAGPTTMRNMRTFNEMLANGTLPEPLVGTNPTADEFSEQLGLSAQKYGLPKSALQGVFNVESFGGVQFRDGKPLVNPKLDSAAVGMGQLNQYAVDDLSQRDGGEIYTYHSVAWDWRVNVDAAANYYSTFYHDDKNTYSGVDRAAFAYKGYHDGNLDGDISKSVPMQKYREKYNAH